MASALRTFDQSGGDIESAYAAAVEQIERARALLAEPVPRVEPRPREADPSAAFSSNMTQAQYEAAVAKAVEYIHARSLIRLEHLLCALNHPMKRRKLSYKPIRDPRLHPLQ